MTTPAPDGPGAPTDRPILIQQGVTFYGTYRWVVAGVAQSLQGHRVVMSIARRRGVPPLLLVTSDDGEIDVEPGGQVGVAEVTISDAKTAGLTKPGVYDLVAIDERRTPRRVVRIAQGPVAVELGVTQLP